MAKETKTNARHNRTKAVILLLNSIRLWGEGYHELDWQLDKLVRNACRIKEKSLGKPPYEDYI